MAQRNIPRSLEECLQEDLVVVELKKWSKRVKTIGLVLLAISSFVGLIVVVSVGYKAGNLTLVNSGHFVRSMDAGSMIVGMTSLAVSIVIGYGIICILSNVLAGFASIIQDTKVNSMLLLYRCQKEEEHHK